MQIYIPKIFKSTLRKKEAKKEWGPLCVDCGFDRERRMAMAVKRYKRIDEDDREVQRYIRLAAEGVITCMEGTRFTGVNREVFRLAVVAEKAKIEAEKAGGKHA